MNMQEIKGNWRQIKGQALEKWGKLTDDEVDQAEGNRDQLVGLLQEKYGKTREEIEREVDDWFSKL